MLKVLNSMISQILKNLLWKLPGLLSPIKTSIVFLKCKKFNVFSILLIFLFNKTAIVAKKI